MTVHTIQTLIMVVIMRRSGIITQARGVEAAVGQTEEGRGVGGMEGWREREGGMALLFSSFFLLLFENICLTWVHVVWRDRRRDEGKDDDTWTKMATASE